MVPDMLIGSFGDCHIYENQIEGVEEQLGRTGFNELPQLIIKGEQKKVEDFKFEDLVIENYLCDKTIKFPLSVG
jgi:thymidylate synthase